MKKVICKNIILGDGYCASCKHSRPHIEDESCGEDCPYDFAIEQECIECNNPAICINSTKCQCHGCLHIVVHDRINTCYEENSCPISNEYVLCVNPITGDKI